MKVHWKQTRQSPAFFLVMLLSFISTSVVNAQQSVQKDSRSETMISVSVWDKDLKFLTNLKGNNFKVMEGKKELSVTSLALSDEAATVGIVINTSKWMGSPNRNTEPGQFVNPEINWLPSISNAVEKLLSSGNPKNEYFIVESGQKSDLMFERTDSHDIILNALDRLATRERTRGYSIGDGLSLAVTELTKHATKKKALILISDSMALGGRYDEIRQSIRKDLIPLYFVEIPRNDTRKPENPLWPSANLRNELVDDTGGISLKIDSSATLSNAAEIIARELQSQYAIKFQAEPSPDRPKWRKISIQVEVADRKHGSEQKLTVRAPGGFFY